MNREQFGIWLAEYAKGKPYWSTAREEICWDAWQAARASGDLVPASAEVLALAQKVIDQGPDGMSAEAYAEMLVGTMYPDGDAAPAELAEYLRAQAKHEEQGFGVVIPEIIAHCKKLREWADQLDAATPGGIQKLMLKWINTEVGEPARAVWDEIDLALMALSVGPFRIGSIPVAVYQAQWIGDEPKWRDMSKHEFENELKTIGSADQHFRIVYSAPPASISADAIKDSGIVERLKIHAADTRNTAFSRSTMREAIELLAAPIASALPSQQKDAR